MPSPRRNGLIAVALTLLAVLAAPAADAPRLRVLFLGDKAGHQPIDRYRLLAPVLKARGIDLVYTESLDDLNAKTLAGYDALAVYANHTKISKEQEKALLDYVAGGKGFVPIHCASFCFLNSPAYIELVGAQFRSHETGTFKTKVVDATHPIMNGYSPFTSWDETYVHTKHNTKDRTVLEVRREGRLEEPWTWVRTHGKGRVFYTAWGHDARTWSHPGFHNLIERGILWSVGRDPAKAGVYAAEPTMTTLPKVLPELSFVPAKVPFYPAGKRWGVTTEPLDRMQKPLPPADSMKYMVHPDDFEVKLFADETLLGGKPICMTWDAKGRLWACITRDYPNNLQRDGNGNDKIVIAEDVDGDGVADKVKVFADKLSIPTSILCSGKGVIIHQAPHTMYLADNDGDDVADSRKILFTGWNTNDTHAGPSNLVYGHDNWIYGIVGYAGFRGTVGGERHSFSTGFYRFKPDGSKLEFLRNTNNNSWGVGISEDGIIFGSTANGNPSVHLAVPNRYYEAVRGWSSSVLPMIATNDRMYPVTDKVRQVDFHGGFTAGAGHALYTARTYPQQYWNRTAFVCEPTGHLVATFTLSPKGSTFVARNSWNLLAGAEEWIAPVVAEVGPDGNVWVIDFYNFIIQHNPTPVGFKTGKGAAYETPLRDVKHGRIYRVVAKNAKAAPKVDLSKATTPELAKALTNDNLLWRRHAQRMLVERQDKTAVPELLKLVADTKTDAVGLNAGAIHALWTLDGLGATDDAAAKKALSHPSAGVRRAAAMVRPPASGTDGPTVSALRNEDPQVLLAVLMSIQAMKTTDTVVGNKLAALLTSADIAGDRWLADALTSAAARHDKFFLQSSLTGALENVPERSLTTLKIVAEHFARGMPDAEAASFVLAGLGDAEGKVAEAVLAGLAAGWRSGHTVALGEKTEKAVVEKLTKLTPAGKASLIRLMTATGSKGIAAQAAAVVKALAATLADEAKTEAERVTAASQMIELAPESGEAVKQVLAVLSPRTSPMMTAGLLDAAALSRSADLGPAVIERLEALTPAAKVGALRLLLNQNAATTALLDAVDKGTVKLGDLALDQKQALAEHPNAAIKARAKAILAKGGDLPNADRQKVIETLLPLLKKTGSVEAGKVVFKNQCAKCHKHGGEGENIGPDLTGMATHPKEELLVHIMDPSRSVEGNFRIYTVTTNGGKSYVGMLSSESKTAIELVDAEAKRRTVQRENIATLTASGKSLMPEGFEKQLKEAELVDLLEFLTAKGKYLPLALDKVATSVSTLGMFFDPESTFERLTLTDWKPRTVKDVPFVLVDPMGTKRKNVVLLYGPNGKQAPKMPKSVSLPVNAAAKAVHLLSGVSGWGHPFSTRKTVSMIVRLTYADGTTEDHPLVNGEHFADYVGRTDVPKSSFAFAMGGGKQMRYLAVTPKKGDVIMKVDLVKGTDESAPVVMAVTVETK